MSRLEMGKVVPGVSRKMLPGHLLTSDSCSPTTLAPQIVEGVGASSSVGEGETEIEIWCWLGLSLGLESKCRWGATARGASFMEPIGLGELRMTPAGSIWSFRTIKKKPLSVPTVDNSRFHWEIY